MGLLVILVMVGPLLACTLEAGVEGVASEQAPEVPVAGGEDVAAGEAPDVPVIGGTAPPLTGTPVVVGDGEGLPVPVSPTEALVETGCFFSTSLENVPLYPAPLSNRFAPVTYWMIPNLEYPLFKSHGEHFYVALDDSTAGWVDRRSGVVSGACGDIPVDESPLGSFPGVCLFTAGGEQPVYNDHLLATPYPRGPMPAGTPYPVLYEAGGSYLLMFDHASGGWVDAGSGEASGDCEAVPDEPLALVEREARLWSQPNAQAGEVVGTLSPGMVVIVVGGPVEGPILIDEDTVGAWLEVAAMHDERVRGWVWVGGLRQ